VGIVDNTRSEATIHGIFHGVLDPIISTSVITGIAFVLVVTTFCIATIRRHEDSERETRGDSTLLLTLTAQDIKTIDSYRLSNMLTNREDAIKRIIEESRTLGT
jgi:hypothetical protein